MNATNKDAFGVPELILGSLSPASQEIVTRLLCHTSEPFDLSTYPASRLAAVLILLYEKAGQIKVLLTTRSKSLRSHPGQTALPGGKCDLSDNSLIDTARREADEEVALPLYSRDIHALCLLRPFVSLHKLLVTPVVALLTDLSLLDSLTPCPEEVDRIFDHPLEAILDPALSVTQDLVPKGSEYWPYESDFHNSSDTEVTWLSNTTYRMHRFRSMASPIKGLTSDILILAAEIAYGHGTVYERFSPGQLSTFSAIARGLEQHEKAELVRFSADLGVVGKVAA